MCSSDLFPSHDIVIVGSESSSLCILYNSATAVKNAGMSSIGISSVALMFLPFRAIGDIARLSVFE